MPDEQKPLQRTRPAAPAMPPFRGHGPAPVRPGLAPNAPGSGRGAPPVVAIRPAKTQPAEPAAQPDPAAMSAAAVQAPGVERPEPSVPALVLEPPGAEVMPPHLAPDLDPPAAPTRAPEAWGSYTPPFETTAGPAETPDSAAAQPLAGLPYFDDAGQPHGAVQSPVAPAAETAESQSHTAVVLERVAARIRTGALTVDGIDGSASEPAALAAVLASLLRHQR